MNEKTLIQRIAQAAKAPAFIFGSLLVAFLVLLMAIGPEIAPNNPYVKSVIQEVEGELLRAPISPCRTYPLGTDAYGVDVLSLLLYGARTTLAIALIATLVRVLLGSILGAAAGWWPGTRIDKVVTAIIEFMAAVPAIVMVILLILAVGIRAGQIAFVLALALVGWGEIAQIIRGHVISIRKQEFIEAARAVGLTAVETLSRHVLPNLTGTVVTMAALEVGSVLLLLSEIGLVQIFLGGGETIAGDFGTPTRIIAGIPEWGAMIGSNWRYFQAKPWLPGAPAIAFAVSILGFNLFGYGLQSFIVRGRFYPSGLSVMRFLSIVAILLFGAQFVLANTGPEQEFRDKARTFDVANTWRHITFMTNPDLMGRYPGSDGAALAASYISKEFADLELTPLPTGSFFQAFHGTHGTITADPELTIAGLDHEAFSFESGFSYDPERPFNQSGNLQVDHLTFVGNPTGRRVVYSVPSGMYFFLGDASYENSIIRIVPDDEFPKHQTAPEFLGPESFLGSEPRFIMTESAAERLSATSGADLDEMRRMAFETNEQHTFNIDTAVQVEYGLEYEFVNGINVIGYMPGSDTRIMTNRILVVVEYSGPSPRDGEPYPGADEDVSAVATMLEIIRTWHAQDFIPRRTVVFAAVSETGAQYLAQEPLFNAGLDDNWTVVLIEGVGAGAARLSAAQSDGGLLNILQDSARRMGSRVDEFENYHFYFSETDSSDAWSLTFPGDYTGIVIDRPGDELSGTLADTREHLNLDYIQEAGEVIGHFLMMLSSN